MPKLGFHGRPSMKTRLLALTIFSAVIASFYWHLSSYRPPAGTSESQAATRLNPPSTAYGRSAKPPRDFLVSNLRSTGTDLNAKRTANMANAVRNTGKSKEELQKAAIFVLESLYTNEGREEFLEDLRSSLKDSQGENEANFLISLTEAESWQEVRAQIDAREQQTGSYYGQLLLDIGLSRGEITADEVTQLVKQGAMLPSTTIHSLARSGQIDTIKTLVERGLLVDINYTDPVTGQNALSVLINNMGYFPGRYTAEEAAAAIYDLVGIGVEVKPQTGAFDPLDHALKVNSSNAKLKLAMAEALLKQGVPVEQSHLELLRRIPEKAARAEFLELFANYL